MNPATHIIDTLRKRFILRNIQKFCSVDKRFLDLGCGNKPYEKYYGQLVKESIGIDVQTSPHDMNKTDIIYDGINIPGEAGKFDFILCTEVLEHVSKPDALLNEVYSVLNKDGILLVTTPFFIGVHEPPYDFYRYTEFGLAHLFESANFEIIRKVTFGGLIGVIIMLICKPQMKFWSFLRKKLRLPGINTLLNPFILCFIYFPQLLYLIVRRSIFVKEAAHLVKVPIGYGFIVQKK